MVTKVKVKLQCPECGHKFFSPSLFPDCCPACGYEYEPEPADNVISMPAIRSAVAKTVDQTYRDLERSSEIRVEQAAAMAGVPVAEMAGLKMTDLKDNTHYGEIAAMPVVNDVTRQMDYIAARGGTVGFQNQGAEFKAGIASGEVAVNGQIMRGVAPRAGNNVMHAINPNADANILGIKQS